jgi:hypothetical protein
MRPPPWVSTLRAPLATSISTIWEVADSWAMPAPPIRAPNVSRVGTSYTTSLSPSADHCGVPVVVVGVDVVNRRTPLPSARIT